ncbi:MAG: outer membrane beta-barrel protein [Bacteroidota bacterium]
MKKLGFIIVCILSFGYLKAQEVGKINVFGGFVLGTAAGIDDDGSSKAQLGVNLGVEYFITNEISAAPSYTSFFESEAGADGAELTAKYNAINLDGRYYFYENEFRLYGLLGIAILNSEIENPPFLSGVGGGGTSVITFTPGETIDDTDVGLNLGGGIVLPIVERLGFNGEIKYQTPGDGQLVLKAGILFGIN